MCTHLRHVYTFKIRVHIPYEQKSMWDTYIYSIKHNKTNTHASISQAEKQKTKKVTDNSFPPPTLPPILVFMLNIPCFFFFNGSYYFVWCLSNILVSFVVLNYDSRLLKRYFEIFYSCGCMWLYFFHLPHLEE